MLLRGRGNLDLVEPDGCEQNPLCHLSQLPQEGQEEHAGHTCVSGARGSSPGVQQVGAMARQGQLSPGSVTAVSQEAPGLGWHVPCCGLSFISVQGPLLIELGVAFCVSCHKQLFLWRVLEGSEIHLERVREFSVFLQ